MGRPPLLRSLLNLGLGLAAAAPACGSGEEELGDAPGAAPAEPPARARPSEALFEVDLSDAAVAELSLEELWRLGVEHLGWPAGPPPGARKDEVHQQLLQGKYRDVGDFGYVEDRRGPGYTGER